MYKSNQSSNREAGKMNSSGRKEHVIIRKKKEGNIPEIEKEQQKYCRANELVGLFPPLAPAPLGVRGRETGKPPSPRNLNTFSGVFSCSLS